MNTFLCRANRPGHVLTEESSETRKTATLLPTKFRYFIGWVLVTASAAACDADVQPSHRPIEPVRDTLSATLSGSRDTLRLSASPTAVAQGSFLRTRLEFDLELGGGEIEFEHLGDVAELPDGRILVLDRSGENVLVFDSLGAILDTLGREGEGPGEFDDPMILTTFGDHVVVFDNKARKQFTIFSVDDFDPLTAPLEIDSDWWSVYFRGPVDLRLEEPFQNGPEDWTRRLAGFGDGHFVYQVQPNEMNARTAQPDFDGGNQPVYLVRFDATGHVIDTLVTGAAPPSKELPVLAANAAPRFGQDIYTSRLVWTTGESWLAVGHGDSSSISVANIDGQDLFTILWPEGRQEVSDQDKMTAVNWLINSRLAVSPRFVQSWGNSDEAVRQDAIERQLAKWTFATQHPYVTVAYGAAQCLWIGGLHPYDSMSGNAMEWIAIDVERREPLGVIEFPEMDTRVRHFTSKAVYTTHRAEDGTARLRRYSLPVEFGCESGSVSPTL